MAHPSRGKEVRVLSIILFRAAREPFACGLRPGPDQRPECCDAPTPRRLRIPRGAEFLTSRSPFHCVLGESGGDEAAGGVHRAAHRPLPVAEAAREAGEAVGVEVLGDVHLKDLSLPHGVAEALSQAEMDKLTAASELERARTEVKITRARMGTAKVLEQNSLLAKIRLLEALPPGTTLELRDRSLETPDQPRETRDQGELDG